MNVLAGVGVLTTPYAVKEGGWLGLLLLFVLSAICCYTGILLRHCLESAPGISTYPDIGQAAFGNTGRLIIAVSTHCMNVYNSSSHPNGFFCNQQFWFVKLGASSCKE